MSPKPLGPEAVESLLLLPVPATAGKAPLLVLRSFSTTFRNDFFKALHLSEVPFALDPLRTFDRTLVQSGETFADRPQWAVSHPEFFPNPRPSFESLEEILGKHPVRKIAQLHSGIVEHGLLVLMQRILHHQTRWTDVAGHLLIVLIKTGL